MQNKSTIDECKIMKELLDAAIEENEDYVAYFEEKTESENYQYDQRDLFSIKHFRNKLLKLYVIESKLNSIINNL